MAKVRGFFFLAFESETMKKRCIMTCNFRNLEVTKHEYSNQKQAKRKTTIFSNILTELGCGRGHRKYERPFVKKEFHMVLNNTKITGPVR